MARSGKKAELPENDAKEPKKSPAKPPEDDEDYEDGDFASPKRDRYGPDDEPL